MGRPQVAEARGSGSGKRRLHQSRTHTDEHCSERDLSSRQNPATDLSFGQGWYVHRIKKQPWDYLLISEAPSPITPAGYCVGTPTSSVSIHASTPQETSMVTPSVPHFQSQGPDIEHDLDNTNASDLEATSPINESYIPEDGLEDIDLRDKPMIVETLHSCGAFIRSWGSTGRSMSRQKLLQLYNTIAHGILVAAQTPGGCSAPVKETSFETGFNLLLATYQWDAKFVQDGMVSAKESEYEDVFRAALFLAARKGAVNLVKVLLNGFGQKTPKDNDGQTCLHVASIHNRPEVVKFLLEREVDVNARSRDGRTPWTSIGHLPSHEDVSKLLIEAGARINDTRPVDWMNNLYQEAAGGHTESVRTLIRRGADPSYATPFGWTPLHFANSVEIVQILVEAGAKVNAVSDTGKTPLDIHFNNHAKKRYLVAHGAK
ncbi:ankyrin repeat-containing domain protein [Colletotrichum cereale]|nr:ankyrin repeat-containing domain protein [Colletotrichum cereale]